VARRVRWRTRVVRDAPHPEHVGEPCVLGVYAMSAVPSRRRWLIGPRPHLVDVAGLVESPGTVARDYLAVAFPRWTPERWATRWPRQWGLPTPWQPMGCRPCTFEDGVYLDVRAMWWTLLLRFGWSLCYSPGRYLGYGDPPGDFPFHDHKVARNCLVTAAMPTLLQTWSPRDGYRVEPRANPHQQIMLVHFISDVMHYVGRLAWDLGAVYVHTDGYVASDGRTAARIAAMIEEHGLQAHTKGVGAGWVRAVGSYRVGDLWSATPMGPPRPLQQFRRLEERERRLLAWHLQH
jgi:hypothetical protein